MADNTKKVLGTVADLAMTVGLWAGVGSAAEIASGVNSQQAPLFLPFASRKVEATYLGYIGAGLTVTGAVTKAFLN